MSDVVPGSERLRRVLAWIAGEREARPGVPVSRLVDEAALRFDLTPAEDTTVRAALGLAPVEND